MRRVFHLPLDGRHAAVDVPHGTVKLKWLRSVATLSLKPWLVIQRLIRTPIAAIFPHGLGSTQTPVGPDTRVSDPEGVERVNEHFLELTDMLCTSRRSSWDQDGISDQLAGAVMGASPPRQSRTATPWSSSCSAVGDVRRLASGRAPSVMTAVLEQKQRVPDRSGAPLSTSCFCSSTAAS